MNHQLLSQAPRRSGLTRYLQRVFRCDVRSLALFRMAISVLVLIDLCARSSLLRAMFTDDGYFTRALADDFYVIASGSEAFSYWSLHKLSGAVEFQAFLFCLTAVVAVCLLVGFYTRVASVLLWILVASMQARNPLLNTSGDMLLKMLLFWSMFLPLGAYWSWDAKRKGSAVLKQVSSFATAGVILQLCYMYLFTGLSKCNEIWFRGEALDYVMHLSIYTRETANFVLHFPYLMKLVSWATVVGEIGLPLLLFLPVWTHAMRWLNIISFWLMHGVIALTMAIGLFSYISMAGWLPLLPDSFWNWPAVRNVTRILDRVFAPTKNHGRRKPKKRVTGYDHLRHCVEWRRGAQWLTNACLLIFIVFFFWWNLGNIDSRWMPRPLVLTGASLNVDQHFRMFDIPPQYNPWFVYDADLANGQRVDIFRNAPVDFERPKFARATIPNHYWRKLHHNLTGQFLADFREPLAMYMVKRWNESHGPDEQVVYMKLTCYMDELGPRSTLGDQVISVWGEYGRSPKRMLQQLWDETTESGLPY